MDSASAEYMDCHADFQSARNDRNNATILKSPQVDSRIFTQNAQNVFSPTRRQDFNLNAASEKVDSSFSAHNATILKHSAQDSRILEIESGFFKPRKEIRLECLSTQRGDEIRDSSPKAESTSQAQKPTPEISPCDSKILDENCGLQGKSQRSYLDGNDCRDFSPLPHFSLKAESPQQKPTPEPSKP